MRIKNDVIGNTRFESIKLQPHHIAFYFHYAVINLMKHLKCDVVIHIIIIMITILHIHFKIAFINQNLMDKMC